MPRMIAPLVKEELHRLTDNAQTGQHIVEPSVGPQERPPSVDTDQELVQKG